MKIVALGDSLTYGYGVRRNKTWTAIVSSSLNIDVINKGVNGDTTSGMLARFNSDVLEEHPDILLVTGGTNDIIFSSSFSTAKNTIVSIVYQAFSHRITPIIGLPLPVCPASVPAIWTQSVDFTAVSETLAEYIKWLQWASDIMGNETIDFYHLFLEDSLSSGALFTDGLHPSEQGHALMADAVIKLIRKKYDLY